MKPRKVLGKISRFLRTAKQGNNKVSAIRRHIRGNSKYPSSSKLGAGEFTARRRKPSAIARLTSHRRHKSGTFLGKIIRTSESNKL